MPVIIFLAAAVIAHVVLRHTRFGLHVYAVGGNAAAADLNGVSSAAGDLPRLRHRRLLLRAGARSCSRRG